MTYSATIINALVHFAKMIKKLLSKLVEGDAGEVFKAMATLAMGTGAARLIGIASIPVLTRLFTPADYGALSVYSAMVLILAPLLSLRYASAIPLPRNEGTALNILTLSFFLAVMNSLLLTLILWFAAPILFVWLSIDVLVPWWWLVVIGAFWASAFEALSMWATRQKAYRPMAKTQAVQSALSEFIKIILGMLAVRPLGLLLGHFAGASSGAIIYILMYRRLYLARKWQVTFSRMKSVAVYYIEYPTYNLMSQALLIFSIQAPALLASAFYGGDIAGQLGLALMAVALPANLIGDTMSRAFYAEISAIGSSKRKLSLAITRSVILRLAILSVAPALIIYLFGEDLFSLVFGPEWRMAGSFSEYLSIYLFFQLAQKPVTYLLYVFNGQRALLYLNLQRALLVVVIFIVGKELELNATLTVFLYSLGMSLHYFACICYAFTFVRRRSD